MIILIHRESRPAQCISCSVISPLWISCIPATLFPRWSLTFCQAAKRFHLQPVAFQIFLSLTFLGGECLLLAAMSYLSLCSRLSPTALDLGLWMTASCFMAEGPGLLGWPPSSQHMHFIFLCSRAIDHFSVKFPPCWCCPVDTTLVNKEFM